MGKPKPGETALSLSANTDVPVFHNSAKEFVGPHVITIPITDKIISEIMPFFPKSAKVIAGYLNEEQLYWKINYHWDVLHEALDHCLGLSIDDRTLKTLKAIKAVLDQNPPDPKTGYRKSPTPGEPKDKSSHEVILVRHKSLLQCKKDFKTVVEQAKIFEKTKRDPKALMLAYAPVASPQKGRHSTGYALDISGNNLDTVRITKALGGYAFNEGSHVHCEWAHGVDKTAQNGANSVEKADRKTKILIDGGIMNTRHCTLRLA